MSLPPLVAPEGPLHRGRAAASVLTVSNALQTRDGFTKAPAALIAHQLVLSIALVLLLPVTELLSRAISWPWSEMTWRLLCGRFGGLGGWIDPNTVHRLSFSASTVIDSASSRITFRAARLQSAGANLLAGPAAIMCLLG